MNKPPPPGPRPREVQPRRSRYLNKKPLTEALRLFVEDLRVQPREPELVAVEESLGRVTAAAVFARSSVPHYHGAAMDGIAVRAADTFGASEAAPVELLPASATGRPTVLPARGKATAKEHPQGTFTYVDTGQPLPPWANAVVMIENVYPTENGRVAVRAAAAPWQHVRLVGEDVVATEALLPRSHRIRPYDIGALLAAGHVRVPVMPRPTVAIIPTGSELIEPGDPAPPGAITEFNSRVIAALVSEWGGSADRLPPVPDDPILIQAAIAAAENGHDVVVIIAGSSAGERDYTLGALGALGEVLVHGIDIMPGKPAICARVGQTPVLGVPGYPVSAVIVCQQLLKPLLAKLLTSTAEPPATMQAILPRKLPSRLGLEEFVRVTLGRVGDRVVANPLPRGAGVITTMVRADGLLRIPSLSEGVNAGEQVAVELLRPPSEIANTIVFSGSNDLTISILEDCVRRRAPQFKVATANVGSLGGLVALKRGEAHVAGTHLLDPRSGTYNVSDITRFFGKKSDVVVITLAIREQGLIVAKGNPKRIQGLRDLVRGGVTFVNRQAGAGTRVLLDYKLQKLRIKPAGISGYEREEFTHMAVAVAVASGLADCGLGIRSAATALDLDFVAIEHEEYDLVMRGDFADSCKGRLLIEAMRSAEFKDAVSALGGYDVSRTGVVKPLTAGVSRAKTKSRSARRRRSSGS